MFSSWDYLISHRLAILLIMVGLQTKPVRNQIVSRKIHWNMVRVKGPTVSRPWLKFDFFGDNWWYPWLTSCFGKRYELTEAFICRAISSDLYPPQSQDEIVEFSFFVALSYEYNLQLGCFWWKKSTSSLKTVFFYEFCDYFCKSPIVIL